MPNETILNMFKKCLADYAKDPIHTKLLFMVPGWTSSEWWPLTKFFKMIKEFPVGTNLFTIPKSKAFGVMKDKPPEADGRIYIGPTRMVTAMQARHSV